MNTTRDDISRWFDRGHKAGHLFMLIICDTFDHSDYPYYMDTVEGTKDMKANPGEMQRVMEIYDLNGNKEGQLNQGRMFAI